jgi:hypothetical protein
LNYLVKVDSGTILENYGRLGRWRSARTGCIWRSDYFEQKRGRTWLEFKPGKSFDSNRNGCFGSRAASEIVRFADPDREHPT